MRHLGRWCALLSVLLVGQMSWACGCGGLIVDENTYTEVPQERALIRWDGTREDIFMELSLESDSPAAALIVPLPRRPRVELADPAIFEELNELTQPKRVKNYVFTTQLFNWGLSGDTTDSAISSQPESVTVLERKTLGALDVAILSAQDTADLATWLAENGYTLPDSYPPLLDAYVARSWFYVAIKLIPEAAETLQGQLDPIWFSFLANQPIYPMQLNAASEARGLLVVVYILADHRMELESHIGADDAVVHYADWVNPANLADDSTLKPLIPEIRFLTKHLSYFWRPEYIDGDFVFVEAENDTIYHQTIQEDVIVGVLGVGILDWLALGLLLGLGVVLVGFIRRIFS